VSAPSTLDLSRLPPIDQIEGHRLTDPERWKVAQELLESTKKRLEELGCKVRWGATFGHYIARGETWNQRGISLEVLPHRDR
jgi:hypothetical protein